MFKLDEHEINRRFGCILDTIPSGIASRSAAFPTVGYLFLIRLPSLTLLRLLGHEESEIGLEVIFTDEILGWKNTDIIELITQQFIQAIISEITAQYFSIGHPLTIGPLMFEYAEGTVEVGDQIMTGTEVVVLTSIKWNSLK
ncbi:hypothetical protein LCGC14_2684680 [marine sediment metagenome]|uniref:Uncharacterized protein n=1 Tax=marine sediment metagenome TaxID=412755 RepID=A0A0F9CC09_9ZZZZ